MQRMALLYFTMKTLKAILRDWLFKDYKWITRASVQREIAALKWEHKDHPLAVRVLDTLSETIK